MSNPIPEGWVSVKSGEIFNFNNGKAFYSDGYSSEGYRVIDLLNIELSGKFLLSSKDKFISEDTYEKYPKAHLSKNDLIIIMTDITPSLGLIGKTAIIDKSNEYVLNQRVGCLRPVNKDISIRFMNYMFNSDLVRLQVVSNTLGTAQFYVNTPVLKNLDIPFPPLPEQKKIATILSSVDDVIEKTQAQINKLKDLKTGMMQELLSPREGSPQALKMGYTEFKDSPVGRIPVGWESLSLSNLVNPERNITYGIVQAGPHCEEGVPYIRVSDMTERKLNLKGMLRTSPEIADKYKRSAVSAGDIVYALRGVIGHVQLVPNELDGANLTQGTARISPKEGVDSNYLLWAMKSPYVEFQNDLEAKGSTFREVTLASLRKIEVAIPPVSDQITITSCLNSIESKEFSAEDKLNQLKSIKKGLMQDLLTGKVRVQVDAA